MKKGDIWRDPSDGELVEILEIQPKWQYRFLNGNREGRVIRKADKAPYYATEFVSRTELYQVIEILSHYK